MTEVRYVRLVIYLPEVDDNRMVGVIFSAVLRVTLPVIDIDVLKSSEKQLEDHRDHFKLWKNLSGSYC